MREKADYDTPRLHEKCRRLMEVVFQPVGLLTLIGQLQVPHPDI